VSVSELDWLERRAEIIRRAIDEMEYQDKQARLVKFSGYEMPGSVKWAQDELARIVARITALG
jgi:hypothetical protein